MHDLTCEWLTLDAAAKRFGVTTGVVRQAIAQVDRRTLRRRTARFMEGNVQVEQYLVCAQDFARLIAATTATATVARPAPSPKR